ncbi:hypothetical protein O9H85_25025 [Paenibacillus filicis]|uniref:Uncharacterized protein n=1 Tax=Paenibacillus gyeongsangnamensis TaxID=3388067 RepID=A0ABT4QFH6_9BACL|nr:hypothetical protein [Paenibacillus filicis]MCZ8515612.1 hypothetical protein [Paenibacillus filicis]
MRSVTRSKLIKWSVSAGCTLAAGLLFNHVKAAPAFTIAHNQALAEGATQPQSAQAQAQDPVQQEYGQFRQRQQDFGQDGGQLQRPHGRHRRLRDGTSQGSAPQDGITSPDYGSQGSGSMTPSTPGTPQTTTPSKPRTRTRSS